MKQVIVVRKDLKMPVGKLAAQVAHAAEGAVAQIYGMAGTDWHKQKGVPWLKGWYDEGRTKVVAKVDSAAQLVALYELGKMNDLPVMIIVDAGRTFFKEPTRTCIAIGPAPDEEVDAITRELKLL